jgi:hypothetical protein
MLRISFKHGSEVFIQSLQNKGPQILRVVFTKLDMLMRQLATYIVAEKLTGNPLQTRTGKLAASVRYVPAEISGSRITFAVEAATGEAFYGRIHERGGSTFYPIMAVHRRALMFLAEGEKVFVRPPAFVMHPPAKPRPFMAQSLEENRQHIIDEVRAAINEALNKP